MGFFKHFIFKIFLITVGGQIFNDKCDGDSKTSYTWVQDSNHQWILKAEFEKADLDTYYDKGPSSEGLGISVENRPTKQVFVYYPAGRSYSGQTYVSYDCQFEQSAWVPNFTSFSSCKEKRWQFFYKDMSIPKIEDYDETDPHFLYTGYALTCIQESLWYKKGPDNKETLGDGDSVFYISYNLSEAAPNKSFWGRLKYQISKFFKFSETDYEIALKEEAKKEHEEYLKEKEECEKYAKLEEEYNKQVLTGEKLESYLKELEIEKKYKIERVYLESELVELRKKYGSDNN